MTPPKGKCLSEKLFEKKKVMSWKEKVGMSDNKEESGSKRRRTEEVCCVCTVCSMLGDWSVMLTLPCKQFFSTTTK